MSAPCWPRGRGEAPLRVRMSSPWTCPLPPLPRLSGAIRADLCVVGLGPVGLAASGLAARLGIRVVGLDDLPLGLAPGARGAGLLRAAVPPGTAHPERVLELLVQHLVSVGRRDVVAVLRTGTVHAPDGLSFPDDLAVDPRERCSLLTDRAWEDGAWLYTSGSTLQITPNGVESDDGTVLAPCVLDVRETGARVRVLAQRSAEDPPADPPWWSGTTLATPGPAGNGWVEADEAAVGRREVDHFSVPSGPATFVQDAHRPVMVVIPEFLAWAEATAEAWIAKMGGRPESDLLRFLPGAP